MSKNPPASAGDAGDTGPIPGSGRSPGGRNGNSLHCSCLSNPMDRGAWWATVHRVAKSQTQLTTHINKTTTTTFYEKCTERERQRDAEIWRETEILHLWSWCIKISLVEKTWRNAGYDLHLAAHRHHCVLHWEILSSRREQFTFLGISGIPLRLKLLLLNNHISLEQRSSGCGMDAPSTWNCPRSTQAWMGKQVPFLQLAGVHFSKAPLLKYPKAWDALGSPFSPFPGKMPSLEKGKPYSHQPSPFYSASAQDKRLLNTN